MGKITTVSSQEFEYLKKKNYITVAGFVRNINPHPREMKKWEKKEEVEEKKEK